MIRTRYEPSEVPSSSTLHEKGQAIQLGDGEIEEIIAEDLTRGQIVKRFGVGEHAAQLARTTAVAIARERRRVTRGLTMPAPPRPEGLINGSGRAGEPRALRSSRSLPPPPLPVPAPAPPQPAPPKLSELAGPLRAAAEAWIADRSNASGPRLGTDRSKIELFLAWLERQEP